VLRTLQTSAPPPDLDALMQDLAEVCRSPLATAEPEVGHATLAVSYVTSVLARAAQTQACGAEAQAQIREAMERAREALARARRAIECVRLTRDPAAALEARLPRLARRVAPSTEVSALVRAWTSARDARVTCPGCIGALVVHYRYRFMEGLGPRELACPRPPCAARFTFYLPVNSFDIAIRASE
jgi:hypothetical protein